jgi:hypothetical protein
MTARRSGRGASLIAMAILLSLSACGQVGESSAGCKKDKDCSGGAACVVSACVPRIMGATQTWALEILPKSDSRNLALTENPAVTFTSDPAEIEVEDKTTIKGEIGDIDPAMTAPSMRVLLSLPSAIGNGERQFETEATRMPEDKTKLRFSIGVPASAVGRSARLGLFPVAPLDQTVPVWSVSLSTLGPTVIVSIPNKADELSVFQGVLTNELDDPVVGWVVRALVGDRLVSNVVKTDSQGRFSTLRIPTALGAGVSLDQVRVELAPPDPTMVKPRLDVSVTANKLNLGILRLPAVPNAQMLDIPVVSHATMSKFLPGVTLRFQATVPKAVGGTAVFVRDFQTDKNGIAHVTLLPGLSGQTRDYTVMVVPPPNSEYATRCFPTFSVGTLPMGPSRTATQIELTNKLELSGRITDGTGAAQSGVIMTVIPRPGSAPNECGQTPSLQATATTAADGSYKLAVDPGRYRIEYEPPMGSASALYVETDVAVAQAMRDRAVMLPGGLLATGVVRAASGDGVLGCEVRVFGQAAGGQLPELRAHTRTTADGHFSIVLPQNP